jgi:hypothetical protein
MIVGALVVGLPMAVAIIWVCSWTCFRAADKRAVFPQLDAATKLAD